MVNVNETNYGNGNESVLLLFERNWLDGLWFEENEWIGLNEMR